MDIMSNKVILNMDDWDKFFNQNRFHDRHMLLLLNLYHKSMWFDDLNIYYIESFFLHSILIV